MLLRTVITRHNPSLSKVVAMGKNVSWLEIVSGVEQGGISSLTFVYNL